MNKNLIFSALLCFLQAAHISAQGKNRIKFGDVSEKDFAVKIYPVDSNANAVVIADIGSGQIEGNSKGWFSVVNKHFKRVHILNKKGFDIADVSISLYTNGTDEEKLDRLKAVTYNLENGKITETKLENKSGLFEDKMDKNWKVKKFTFPNVKEGSIIEFEYATTSDFISYLDPWEFQGDYPRLWSEYTLTVPSFFYYVFFKQGFLRFDIDERKDGNTTFNVTVPGGTGASEHITVNAGITDYHWVIKNVPALKEENYTSTIDNHIQKIEFQLVERREPLTFFKYIESWPQVAKGMMESEYFGLQLDKENNWLKEICAPLVKDISDEKEKAIKIFNYVRDNFSCTDHSRRFMDQPLKNILKNHKGSVAEINLMLIAMLKYVSINADPVLLSTRSHGYAYPVYPIMSQYNYVIGRAVIGDKTYYLDASEPLMGFGRLPLRCYNGYARLINKAAEAIELNSDGVSEVKQTTIFIINNESGNMIGSLQQTPGYYESNHLRERIKEKGRDQLIKDIEKDFGTEIVISNFQLDSLEKPDFELGLHYDFDVKNEKEDIIYLNPLFGEANKENLFKSAERHYPVEMPFTWDETINLQMEVPYGYIVDELPKSLIVKLNEQDDGIFEYRISQSGENISLRSRTRFKRSTFMPEEYETLREFFNLIVNKQSEQIVFKKKK
ncbi:MAG: transglutaminase domain-containing protein [Chitinophagaceae bacterium]